MDTYPNSKANNDSDGKVESEVKAGVHSQSTANMGLTRQPFTRAILFIIVFIVLLFLFAITISPLVPRNSERFTYGACGTIAAILATWIFLRLDQRKFSDIGLNWSRGTLLRFGCGLLIGTALFAVILFFLISFAGYRITRADTVFSIGSALAYLAIIPLAFMEEVAFRAYPFVRLHQAYGLRPTQVIIAVCFALYHVIGGMDMYSAFLGPGTWAFVFGLAAAWSRGIAVPTGIHVALNVFQPLFGMKALYVAVWSLALAKDLPASASSVAANWGLAIQLGLFGIAIAGMEYYLRRVKPKFPG